MDFGWWKAVYDHRVAMKSPCGWDLLLPSTMKMIYLSLKFAIQGLQYKNIASNNFNSIALEWIGGREYVFPGRIVVGAILVGSPRSEGRPPEISEIPGKLGMTCRKISGLPPED